MPSFSFGNSKIKFDIIGDLAIIKKDNNLNEEDYYTISNTIINLGYAKSVYLQTSPHSGLERTRSLKWLAGEQRTATLHKENNYLLKVDIEKVFFTPRLHAEHLRIGKLVKPNEYVFNMFSGVGAFSIAIAVYAMPELIISSDINEYATKLTLENAHINKVSSLIEVIRSDSGFLSEGFSNIFDRILMPLPLLAKTYMPQAIKALKREGWIHAYDAYYGKSRRDAIRSAVHDYTYLMRKLNVSYYYLDGHVVGSIAPHRYRVVVDIFIKDKIKTF